MSRLLAIQEADKAIRQSLAKFQGLMSASAAPDSGLDPFDPAALHFSIFTVL